MTICRAPLPLSPSPSDDFMLLGGESAATAAFAGLDLRLLVLDRSSSVVEMVLPRSSGGGACLRDEPGDEAEAAAPTAATADAAPTAAAFVRPFRSGKHLHIQHFKTFER